jgi:thiosulfate/3-mercaptopyruvate sulfurtransferase
VRVVALLLLLSLTVSASGTGIDGLQPLVDPAWLAQRLGDKRVVVLDIRNPFGGANRLNYVIGHVPGAVYSNYVVDAWHDHGTSVPVTLPSIDQLQALLGRLGIGNDERVVLVHSGTDSGDFSTAARAYWIFRLLGHDGVAILNGGFRAWEAAGLPVEQGWNEPQPATFSIILRKEFLATTEEVEQAMRRGAQLVDGRARDYYFGWIKAPLAERPGTLPGAINLEHRRLIEPDTGRFLSPEALAVVLQEAGIDPQRETVVFCNVGHWSAAIWFALSEIAGFRNVSLYDGSMVEWTSSPERPVLIPEDPAWD